MKEKLKCPKMDVPNLLVVSLVVLVLARNLLPIPGIVSNMMIAGCGCLGFLYVFLKKYKEKSMWKVVALALFLSVCMLCSIFYNHNASLGEVLWIWCFMGTALLLCWFEIDKTWFVYLFFLLAAYFLVCIVMCRNVNAILYGTSRNGIAALLLFLMLGVYLGQRKSEMIWYLPVALSVVISAWSLSRAGLLVSAFFGVAVLFYDFIIRKKGSIKRLVWTVGIMAVSFFLIINVFPSNDSDVYLEDGDMQYVNEEHGNTGEEIGSKTDDENNVTIMNKFQGQGLKSTRLKIWSEYFTRMMHSGKEFFLGVTYDDGEFLQKYQNPHNGYLELHSKFGLLGFVTVMVLLLVTFWRECNRKDIFGVIIFLTILMRAFFDWIVFPGYYDVLVWFFVFENVLVKRQDDEKIQCVG